MGAASLMDPVPASQAGNSSQKAEKEAGRYLEPSVPTTVADLKSPCTLWEWTSPPGDLVAVLPHDPHQGPSMGWGRKLTAPPAGLGPPGRPLGYRVFKVSQGSDYGGKIDGHRPFLQTTQPATAGDKSPLLALTFLGALGHKRSPEFVASGGQRIWKDSLGVTQTLWASGNLQAITCSV